MKWKLELEDCLDDLIRVMEGEKVIFTQRQAREQIKYFISTEIIEKLIADIPESMFNGNTHQGVNLEPLKQQLKAKWLERN